MMGGEIGDYQKKSIPSFLLHLREKDPEMWQKLISERPELDVKPNNIGREAYIKTLKPGINIGAYDNRYPVNWKWDGKVLTTKNDDAYNKTWGHIKLESMELVAIPKDDAIIKVASEDWITSDTKFLQ